MRKGSFQSSGLGSEAISTVCADTKREGLVGSSLPIAKKICLTKGAVAIVGDEDYDRLDQFNWHLGTCGYAVRKVRYFPGDRQHAQYLHYMILQKRDGFWADHINRDKLDNRRCNLRLVPIAKSNYNRRKLGNSKMPYRGIEFSPPRHWRAKIRIGGGRRITLGYYDTAEKASLAYEYAKLTYHNMKEEPCAQ